MQVSVSEIVRWWRNAYVHFGQSSLSYQALRPRPRNTPQWSVFLSSPYYHSFRDRGRDNRLSADRVKLSTSYYLTSYYQQHEGTIRGRPLHTPSPPLPPTLEHQHPTTATTQPSVPLLTLISLLPHLALQCIVPLHSTSFSQYSCVH